MTTIEKFPTELLQSIISFLPPSPSNLVSFECTCKRWKMLMNGDVGVRCWFMLAIHRIILQRQQQSEDEQEVLSHLSELERQIYNHGTVTIDNEETKCKERNVYEQEEKNKDGCVTFSLNLAEAKQAFRNVQPQPFCFSSTSPDRTIKLDRYETGRVFVSDICFPNSPNVPKLIPSGSNSWILSRRLPYYFEVKVVQVVNSHQDLSTTLPARRRRRRRRRRVDAPREDCLSIGIRFTLHPIHRSGQEYYNAIEYHSKDGRLYFNSPVSSIFFSRVSTFGPNFGSQVGDVVGCGLDLQKSKMIFTLNGQFLGVSDVRVPHGNEDENNKFYSHPVLGVGLYSKLKYNFGTEPFVYELNVYESDLLKFDSVEGRNT